MLVIVEGMDNTGKTHLIQRVAEDLKLLVMNNRQKPRSEGDMWKYLQAVSLLNQDWPLILDRICTISEPIYGNLRKSGPVIDPHVVETHLDTLKKQNPLIIYCRPPTAVVLNFGDRPQMEGVIENAKTLLAAYDRSMDNLAMAGFKVVHWDYTNYNYDWLLGKVINHLKEAK